MLSSYQEIVRFLLCQNDYPGVTAEELDFFKSQFRTSAFTCRLSSCPRTTVGFESEELLREHEVAHTRRIACTFLNCKYPTFASVQSLKNHIKKYHNSDPAPKSIRKVGHFLMKSEATQPKKEPDHDARTTNSVNTVNLTQQQPQIYPQFGASAAQQHIYQTITQQTGPLNGWQAHILINERMSLVFNM